MMDFMVDLGPSVKLKVKKNPEKALALLKDHLELSKANADNPNDRWEILD